MRWLLVALTALTAVLCPLPILASFIDWSTVSDEFMVLQWNQFKSTYDKHYDTVKEEAQRFQIFQNNMARAALLNAQNPDATFGVTRFSDLDPAEFKAIYLRASRPTGADAAKRVSHAVKTDAPMAPPSTDVDWRGKVVSAVKDQGSCGSCWAFSATETVESAYFMKYGFDANFTLSPQQLVDCDPQSLGCNGGWPNWAFDYLEKTGQESESAYPYTAKTGTCKYNPADVKAKISGWTYMTPPCNSTFCPKQDEQTLLNNLATVGPISICVDASEWQDYTGGVMANGCSRGYGTLDHCVQLVGYNSTGDGYWIVRNSWGANWGESGYIYLEFGKNMCGLGDDATFPAIV